MPIVRLPLSPTLTPDNIHFRRRHHFTKQLGVDLGTRIIPPIRMDDVDNLQTDVADRLYRQPEQFRRYTAPF
jgi:hypothetical protein